MTTESSDISAEQALLGSAMQWPETAGPSLLLVDAADFYAPAHQQLAQVVMDMLRDKASIDPATVVTEIQSRAQYRAGFLDHIKVFEIWERAFTPQSAPVYAESIRAHTRRRKLSEAALRLEQRISEADAEVAAVVAAHERDLEMIPPPLDESTLRMPMTLRELLESFDPLTPHDWMIPGLWERMERIVLTGGEGGGKSELLAQFTCCLAAGLHPFTGFPTQMPPMRVLMVDFENSKAQQMRRFERIARIIGSYPAQPDWRDRVYFEAWGRSDIVGDDRTRFENLVASVSPDALITGPAYQMGMTDPNSEVEVLKFTDVLDRIRKRHGCGVMLEAHPGHTQDRHGKRLMRPSGSSVWLRWPEIGIGSERNEQDRGQQMPSNLDVVAWRSPREGRAWPGALVRGGPGQLPWQPDDRRYLDEMRIEREIAEGEF